MSFKDFQKRLDTRIKSNEDIEAQISNIIEYRSELGEFCRTDVLISAMRELLKIREQAANER